MLSSIGLSSMASQRQVTSRCPAYDRKPSAGSTHKLAARCVLADLAVHPLVPPLDTEYPVTQHDARLDAPHALLTNRPPMSSRSQSKLMIIRRLRAHIAQHRIQRSRRTAMTEAEPLRCPWCVSGMLEVFLGIGTPDRWTARDGIRGLWHPVRREVHVLGYRPFRCLLWDQLRLDVGVRRAVVQRVAVGGC